MSVGVEDGDNPPPIRFTEFLSPTFSHNYSRNGYYIYEKGIFPLWRYLYDHFFNYIHFPANKYTLTGVSAGRHIYVLL